jgi:hypothetical protein
MATKEVQRISEVKKVAVSSFGSTDAATLVREKFINRLAKSGQLQVVDEPRDADAVFSGIVGANVYGRADSAAIRLSTGTGRILWSDETSVRGFGSASSHMAETLCDHFLNAIKKDK